jgi:predicted transcriptional regulator
MGLGVFGLFFLGAINGLWLLVIGFIVNANARASLNQTIISEALGNVKVRDIMTSEIITIEPSLSLQQAVDRYFQRYKHGGYPVINGGHIKGMITVHDVTQVPEERWDEYRVEDIMKPVEDLYTMEPDDNSADALMKMAKRDVGRLPVMEKGELIGIITRSDIARAIKLRTSLGKKGKDDFFEKLVQS